MGDTAVQGLEIVEKCFFKAAGEFAQRSFGFADALDDFVVNVRDVHHVLRGKALKFEVTANEVAENKGAPVADMGEVVNGRAAAIHTHLIPGWIERGKLLGFAS